MIANRISSIAGGRRGRGRLNAVSVAGLHPDLPADCGRDLLRGGGVGASAARGADRGVARLLRLVGRALHRAAGRADRRNLAARVLAQTRLGRAALLHRRHRAQPRLAGDLQVSRFSPRVGGIARRRCAAARPYPAADRHQLLLVPAHLLPGRPAARRRAALSVPPVRAVRAVVSPPDRGADRAPQRAGAAVRARSRGATACGAASRSG